MAIIPIGGVLLFLLLLLLGEHSGEAGLAAAVAMALILGVGANIAVVSSLVGVALGIFAVCKTRWRQGTPGLILNILVLILEK